MSSKRDLLYSKTASKTKLKHRGFDDNESLNSDENSKFKRVESVSKVQLDAAGKLVVKPDKDG